MYVVSGHMTCERVHRRPRMLEVPMLLRSRIRTHALPGVALAITAACSSPTSTPTQPPSPDPTGDPPAIQAPTDIDRTAVALGMTIDARDASGAPRLIRAIVPRQGVAGMAPDQAARA